MDEIEFLQSVLLDDSLGTVHPFELYFCLCFKSEINTLFWYKYPIKLENTLD